MLLLEKKHCSPKEIEWLRRKVQALQTNKESNRKKRELYEGINRLWKKAKTQNNNTCRK